MLNDKTLKFLSKIAQDSTGAAQMKKRVSRTQKDYIGEGAGLGGVLGTAAGALSKKLRPINMAAGAIFGSLIGRELGKRTIGKTKSVSQEGVIKKQQKTKSGDGAAEVPKLNDMKILRLLGK